VIARLIRGSLSLLFAARRIHFRRNAKSFDQASEEQPTRSCAGIGQRWCRQQLGAKRLRRANSAPHRASGDRAPIWDPDGFIAFTNGTATAHVATSLIISSQSDDAVVRSADSDNINALAGNDTIAGGAGADTMGGGAGDDLFLVTDASDLLIETAAAGADTIITSVSMTMPDHVETLRIASGTSGITLTGGAGNDMLIGNGLANTFNGGAGDDVVLAGNVTLADIYALFAT
jgi:Ca2+-binding RTX toxin-like protein